MVPVLGDKRATLILLLILSSLIVNLPYVGIVKAEPNTIVVPDDYSTIQAVINAATQEDTIFVKKGTYYEKITIDKSLLIIGEDQKTTIIDGGYNRTVVIITRNGVNVTGFTIRNGKQAGIPSFIPPPEPEAGIHLLSANYCNISENTITNNDYGIFLYYSSDNNIAGNNITNSSYGIQLESSSNNRLVANNITNNTNGIKLEFSSNNIVDGNNITAQVYDGILLRNDCNYNSIVGNTITKNRDGIGVWTPSDFISILENTISSNNNAGMLLSNLHNSSIIGNNITNNNIGIWLYTSSDIIEFYNNNIINNTIQVNTFPDNGNSWDNGVQGNYWDDYIGVDNDGEGIGDTPYFIDENNQDNYPLISEFIIPEFPSWIILPILVVSTLIVISLRNKIRKKED